MEKKRKSKYTHISLAKKAADHAFSDYIRLRDKYKCITCGKEGDKHNIDAGHYLRRGYTAIKYDERNVSAQCTYCNQWLQGAWDVYNEKMLEKYGQEVVDELMSLRYVECKMSIQDYLEIERKYREKLREFE